MFVPNLSRLAHRPLPTGVGPPRTRARARKEQAATQTAVLSNSDLLAKILAALNTANGPDDACAMAMSYCAAQRGACAEDTWRALLALVFPESGGPSATPKAKFLALCRRWNGGRKVRYERYLALHQRMVPPGGLVPMAHLARIIDWFSNVHNYAFEDNQAYQEYLYNVPMDVVILGNDYGYDNYAVWYLVNFLAIWRFDSIAQMLHGGLLHVSNVFVPPPMDVYKGNDSFAIHNWGNVFVPPPPDVYNGTDTFATDTWGNSGTAAIRLGNPRTLLGFLLVRKARPEVVEVLLNTYAADPNAKFASVEHLAFEEHVVPQEHLNYDDEGAAECLALRHIYAIMGRKLQRQFGRALKADDMNPFELTTVMDLKSYEWFDQEVPNGFGVPGRKMIRGERTKMLSYYRLLYNSGGDVYNAAMMYRAYGEEFHEFCARDMAEHIEEFARFVTTAEGTVPITDDLRANLLAKHRARLRWRDPYYSAPAFARDGGDEHQLDALEGRQDDSAAGALGGD